MTIGRLTAALGRFLNAVASSGSSSESAFFFFFFGCTSGEAVEVARFWPGLGGKLRASASINLTSSRGLVSEVRFE
jgi:hypothetical protein